MAASVTDEELVVALRGGDLAAFDELYVRFERRLFGYVQRTLTSREMAEDVFQDVFFTVLRDRSYDPERGRFSAWLFTVARNRCLQELRRGVTRQAAEPMQAAVVIDDPEGADEVVGRMRHVRAAMDELTEGQRQILLLKQVGELTYREIADMHGVAEGTIKSRLHEAMKAFRRRLTETAGGLP